MSATPKVSPEASPVKLGPTGVRRINNRAGIHYLFWFCRIPFGDGHGRL